MHIDGDNLDAAYPRPEGSGLMLANLKAMWMNFAAMATGRGGYLLIVSGTAMVMEHSGVRRVVEEVSSCEVVVKGIVLTATEEVVEARLREREIGTDLESHLRSSERMAKELDRFDELSVLRVDTGDQGVPATAERIIEHMFLEDRDR